MGNPFFVVADVFDVEMSTSVTKIDFDKGIDHP